VSARTAILAQEEVVRTVIAYFQLFVFLLMRLLLRFLYGFRIEGSENLPRSGPFILLMGEAGGPACTLCVAAASVGLLGKMMRTQPDKVISTMHEDLWAKVGRLIPLSNRPRPLRPQSAGLLALGMLDGYRALKEKGGVIINPEGSLSWDGRPLPVRPGAAWLGLRTAAPLVPFVCSAGGYDIWPLWQKRPSLRGQVKVRIGEPFRLCDSAKEQVTHRDLETANAQIRKELDRLYLGPDGAVGWAGPPLKHGTQLEEPIRLQLAEEPAPPPSNGANSNGAHSRGIPLLLWRCPICHSHDALVHERALGRRPETLGCHACATRWEIHRTPGRDFRLTVVEGRPDLQGLDMALTAWYDAMKEGFRPLAIPPPDGRLLPREELYLQADGIELLPYRSSELFAGWTGREPPRVQPTGDFQPGNWASLGTGQLFLTNHRLFWEGVQGGLDFQWASIRAVFLPWLNILGISYGAAVYRFRLGHEVGLKWLTYAGTLAQQVAEHEGYPITVTPF
jgi:1-acyl-sn-glycerol-3-phosphate acyltransferase